jgi:hypothetical protein
MFCKRHATWQVRTDLPCQWFGLYTRVYIYIYIYIGNPENISTSLSSSINCSHSKDIKQFLYCSHYDGNRKISVGTVWKHSDRVLCPHHRAAMQHHRLKLVPYSTRRTGKLNRGFLIQQNTARKFSRNGQTIGYLHGSVLPSLEDWKSAWLNKPTPGIDNSSIWSAKLSTSYEISRMRIPSSI